MTDELDVGVSIRFVPAGIYIDDKSKKTVIRGALVFIPAKKEETQFSAPLNRWPTEIQTRLKDLSIFWKPMASADPSHVPVNVPGVPVQGVVLKYEVSQDHLEIAQRTWEALVAPPKETSKNPYTCVLLKTYERTQNPLLKGAYDAVTNPWLALATTTRGQKPEQTSRLFAEPAARTGAAPVGTPRVSCAPLARTAQLLTGLDSIRVADSMCRAAGSVHGLAFAPASPGSENEASPRATAAAGHDFRRLRWTGLPHLFSGPRQEPPQNPPPDDWAGWTLRQVAMRGLTKAMKTVSQLREETRFRYLAPPAEVRPSLTVPLASRIRSAVEAHTAIAENIFRRTMPFLKSGLNTDEVATRRARTPLRNTGTVWVGGAHSQERWPVQSEAGRALYDAPTHRIANSLWPQAAKKAPLAPEAALSDLQSATQTAIAMHLMDLRPDEARDTSGIVVDKRDLCGTNPKVVSDKLDEFARAAAAAPQKRLFGLLAYPALARALRLVIDVEFDLPMGTERSQVLSEGERNHFLWFGASFDANERMIPLWTASKLRPDRSDFHFGVCSQEELEITARGLHLLDGEDNPNPPQFDGIVTLGSNYDGAGPRFALESLDVVSRAEQYVNASEGEASAEQSGQSLEHAGSAVGPPRTAGIVLHDRGRGAAVTTQLAGTVDHAGKRSGEPGSGTPGSPKGLFANDLNIGFRADVAVISRKSGSSGADKPKIEWRTLADRWIKFDKDEIENLVQRTLMQATPSNLSWSEFRVRIDEQGVKFPTRLIVHNQPSLDDKAKAAQQVAQEIVLQWLGPLPGAPSSDASGSDSNAGITVDPATDLPLSVTLSLVSNSALAKKVGLPPWLEIGRGFRIGMAGICLGGISVSLEEAKRTYAKTVHPLTIPPVTRTDPDPFFVFRRHEPVAAPVVAVLYQGKNKPPKDDRGDTLTGIVVRSQNGLPAIASKYAPTKSSARVIYVRGVPQSFAALHPIQPVKGIVPHMILNDLRVITRDSIKRLCGGFQYVVLDPQSAGLPVGWKGGHPTFPPRTNGTAPNAESVTGKDQDAVFWIDSASNETLLKREAQYFPDPAVSGFVIEARTKGPRAALIERRFIPIYDSTKKQAVTYETFHSDREAVRFPHAMPIYLEVNALKDARVGRILSEKLEFGSIEREGHFSSDPSPSGPSVTSIRVGVNLAPGEEVELRIWSRLSPEVISGWFQSNEHVVALASAVGGGAPEALDAAAAVEGLIRMFGPTEHHLKPLGSGTGFTKEAWTKFLVGQRPNLAAVRDWVAGNLRDALDAGPITGLSQDVSLTATHAILRPRFAPVFVRRDAMGAPQRVADEDNQNPLGILRHTFASPDKWTDWLTSEAHRDVAAWPRWETPTPPGDEATDLHEAGALAAWFGGIAALDLRTTSQLILRASYLDVNDDPSQWPSAEHPSTDDVPVFKTVNLELFRTADLQKESCRELIKDRDGHELDVINLLEASDGSVRALSWQFQDTRARLLTVRYVALSRFWNYFVKQEDLKPNAMPASPAAFEYEGERRTVWLPSTRRPDPIAKVEFLPTFVYVTEEGNQRSRHFRARLRMRRAKGEHGWFSSGEGEELALVLWPPDLFEPEPNTNIQDGIECGDLVPMSNVNFQLGAGGPYISRWGSDPIREGGADPTWLMSRKVFQENIRSGAARFVDKLNPGVTDPNDNPQRIYMPIPVPASDPAAAPSASSPPEPLQVCLLCFRPKYDHVENLWYVDVAIDPGPVARPFVRLGLARFQEHSLRGLEVSEPTTLQFQLEPYRRIRVHALEKPTDKGWPIEIAVYGPSSVVVGGRGVTNASIEPAQAEYQKQRSPKFCVRLLHDDIEYLDTEIKRFEACTSEVDLDLHAPCEPFGPQSTLGPPADDEIWRAVIYAKTDPADSHHPHDLILEEVDLMLSASMKGNDINASKSLVPTGPRFAAKVRVHRIIRP